MTTKFEILSKLISNNRVHLTKDVIDILREQINTIDCEYERKQLCTLLYQSDADPTGITEPLTPQPDLVRQRTCSITPSYNHDWLCDASMAMSEQFITAIHTNRNDRVCFTLHPPTISTIGGVSIGFLIHIVSRGTGVCAPTKTVEVACVLHQCSLCITAWCTTDISNDRRCYYSNIVPINDVANDGRNLTSIAFDYIAVYVVSMMSGDG